MLISARVPLFFSAILVACSCGSAAPTKRDGLAFASGSPATVRASTAPRPTAFLAQAPPGATVDVTGGTVTPPTTAVPDPNGLVELDESAGFPVQPVALRVGDRLHITLHVKGFPWDALQLRAANGQQPPLRQLEDRSQGGVDDVTYRAVAGGTVFVTAQQHDPCQSCHRATPMFQALVTVS
jgi:hypothetical protein